MRTAIPSSSSSRVSSPLAISALAVLLVLVLTATGAATAERARATASWDCRGSAQQENRRLYVSTLDGVLTAIDLTSGRIQWQHDSNIPLYSSTLSYLEPSPSFPNLIPGLDKNLYQWDGNELNRLPFSVDDLLDQTYVSSVGLLRAGGRSKDDVAINVATGKPLYKCTQFSCDRYDNQSLIGRVDQLLLTSHRTTVREANSVTGEEIWNFTLSQVFLSLIEGEEELEMSCVLEKEDSWLSVYSDTIKGLLIIMDPLTKMSWDFQFSSPVFKVWLQRGGKLKEISLAPITDEGHNLRPALMLGAWHQQYYIIPVNRQTDSLLMNYSPPAPSPPGASRCFQSSKFLPSLPSSLPDSSYLASNALTLYLNDYNWIQTLYTKGPNGLALYFHPKIDEDLSEDICSMGENSSDEETTPTPLSLPNSSYLLVFWDWLKFLAKYGAFAACVLGVNKFRRHHMEKRRRQRLTSSTSSSDSDDIFLNETDEMFLDNYQIHHSRRTSSTSTLKPTGTYSILPTVEEEGTPGLNMCCVKQIESMESITSRFETEYDRLGILGKGGFGVVYHVSNTVDKREYAIKRIKLPTKKSAHDKVMREVHALAQLEHPAIVRYFSSWVERAPPGWDQREEWISISRVDSLLQMEDEFSSKPSSSFSSLPNGFPLSGASSNSYNELLSSRCQSSDSQHSSFTIEFRDDSHSRVNEEHHLTSRGEECAPPDDEGALVEDSNCCSVPDKSAFSGVNTIAPTPTFLFIQMQLCQKETMREWLRNNVYNRERVVIVRQFKQILDAVVYVHGKGLMHRDLKPSNIFFSLSGNIKIGDFGLVTGNIAPDTHRNSHIALKLLSEEKSEGRHTSNIGTHFYVSPEQLNGLQYDQKVDVFSLGVILFELNFPFATEMERVKVLEELRKNRIPPEFRKHLTCEATLVDWLMSPVAKRPSADQVAISEKLVKLQETTKNSDLLFIPKL